MITIAYGLPRLGRRRQYKHSIEGVWKDDYSAESIANLEQTLRSLQHETIATYAGHVDRFPIGEMTGYDSMLDTAILTGRYRPDDWRAYYDLCRGGSALEMTKWFNTNYHYLVPEFDGIEPDDLQLHPDWLHRLDPDALPADAPRAFIGPYTFLRLSKGIEPKRFDAFLQVLAQLYRDLLRDIPQVWLFEPACALDPNRGDVQSIQRAYRTIGESQSQIALFCYYDSIDFLRDLYDLPLAAIGLDLVHGAANIDDIVSKGFPQDKQLIAGLIDGRNVWRTNIDAIVTILKRLSRSVSDLAISNAAPLSHLPVTLEGETLDPQLLARLAFAVEKLDDIRLAAQVYDGTAQWHLPHAEPFGIDTAVRQRVANLRESDFVRQPHYGERRTIQQRTFDLPLFPTTTIGSFPQTREVRKARADFRNGQISATEYEAFVNQTIAKTIAIQENIGLDVLVHGESERSDMVEFFAEKLDGIAFTRNGWILSYGTRGYRPPVIYGDVSRPAPMTTREIAYAQSLTTRPVKGMLTGPITILSWSFVRNDIPIKEVAYQISLALQDEVRDYEKANIGMIQIDEPAFREMVPNKRRHWDAYFAWAIKAFRLCCATAAPQTQIHSHMCYSEFNEIIDQIDKMDFDVISIEATRSRGEVIECFEQIDCRRQIGLGVYDIHSPVIPKSQEIAAIIKRAVKVIPRENFWINPDCGLKTRSLQEAVAALEIMVAQAQAFRG